MLYNLNGHPVITTAFDFVPVHGVDRRRRPGHARARVVVADGLDGGGDDAGEHPEDAGHCHRREAPLDFKSGRKMGGSLNFYQIIHQTIERGAIGLTLGFCLFLFRSSLSNLFFAWLRSSCGVAHQPVELSGKLLTKPCVRPSALLCTFFMKSFNLARLKTTYMGMETGTRRTSE